MMHLDSPTIAAEATAVVLFVHGALHALAPASTARMYNVPKNDKNGEYNNIIIRSIGCNLLFTSMLVLCLTIGEMERYNSYLLVTTIWFVDHLTQVLNNKEGTTNIPDAVMVCFDALLLLGFCWDDGWPAFTAQAGVFELFLFGLGFAFFTKFFFCQVWQIPESYLSGGDGAHHYFLGRVFGLTMVQSAVLLAALEFGDKSIVRAFAMSCNVLSLSVLLLPLVSTSAAGIGLTTRHVFMAVGCAIATLVMLLG